MATWAKDGHPSPRTSCTGIRKKYNDFLVLYETQLDDSGIIHRTSERFLKKSSSERKKDAVLLSD